MENSTKHQKIVLEYVKSSNIEFLVQNSIRTLISADTLPDNPFGALSRHFTYFAAKDDLKRLQIKVREYQMNRLELPQKFGITNVTNEVELWSLPHLLHYINPKSTKILIKVLKEFCTEQKRSYGEYKLQSRIAVLGGELFRSSLIHVPEIAPTQLEIRAECFVTGPNFEQSFELFAEFVYEDVMRLGSNNSLNLIRDFYVEQDPQTNYVKKVTFEEIKENKQLFISELKSAIVQKRRSYIRVLLFTQDLARVGIRDMVRASTPTRFVNSSEAAVSDHFQYITTKKSYVMHYSKPDSPLVYETTSHIPMISLFQGVFPNPDSARNYAEMFYTEKKNPYDTPHIQKYLESKREQIIKYYKKGKIITMLWEVFLLVLCTSESSKNAALIEELLQIFAHNSSKLYRMQKLNFALKILINAYYDTNFSHFQKLAEGLFVGFKEGMLDIFGDCSSAEMLLLRELTKNMLNFISVNKSRTLDFHSYTLIILDRLEYICRSLAQNTTEMLLRQSPAVNELLSRLLSAYNVQQYLSHSELLEGKLTEQVFDLKEEVKKQKTKKNMEYQVICEYIAKTGVMETLILTTRDILLSYPLLPNPLKIFAMKLMCEIFKYDMFNADQNDILDNNCRVPNIVQGQMYQSDPTGENYKNSQLPYIIGFEEVLFVSNADEIGFFKLILYPYEVLHLSANESLPEGYNLRIVSSICGQSVMNSLAFRKQATLWHVSYGFYMNGPSFNAGTHSFLDLLIRYALWLDFSTDAFVSGFYTSHSDEPLASFQDLISPSDRENSLGLLLSAYQMNTPVWLRYIIPYKGDKDLDVEAHFIAVHVYFNLHFATGMGSIRTTLTPLQNLEDIVKVFFSQEDFELWLEVGPTDVSSSQVIDKFFDRVNHSYDVGQYFRGYLYTLFIKVFERDEEETIKLLRMKETPLVVMLEATEICAAMLDIASLGLKNHRKFNLEYSVFALEQLKNFCERCIYMERNIFLESLQPSIIRVLQITENLLKEHGTNKLERVVSNLLWARDALKVQNKLATLALYEVLKDNPEFAG
ncbi:unnamed protein product [Blepharisma stoltei]|uniref:Uncharacterized protein n=1 Tax=Blepharisma stoltei TaxID=1481888 RepID=A0AAU9IID8_9CILI|nr:unnamed protein product [Blepharisma stoltei]